ncbi:hypothetical protein J437_LFUL004642 [Ladona fulva]|uniref:Uncharacterized protein n=1 Tax=Ladona fulva TaxID=123851 RepID=A0A8K0NWU9_LADFU|nr:hypothetical protein J437_LFUL004642 [Ladona fulva]
MKIRRLEWAGHVVRMSREQWPKIAMDMIPEGKRPLGWLRKRWIDGVKEDLQLLGAWEEWQQTANNRKEWRTLKSSWDTNWVVTWYNTDVSDDSPRMAPALAVETSNITNQALSPTNRNKMNDKEH